MTTKTMLSRSALGATLAKELQLRLDTSSWIVRPLISRWIDAPIDSSGIYRLNLSGDATSDDNPMAPRGDGKIVWFGCVDGFCGGWL